MFHAKKPNLDFHGGWSISLNQKISSRLDDISIPLLTCKYSGPVIGCHLGYIPHPTGTVALSMDVARQ